MIKLGWRLRAHAEGAHAEEPKARKRATLPNATREDRGGTVHHMGEVDPASRTNTALWIGTAALFVYNNDGLELLATRTSSAYPVARILCLTVSQSDAGSP